MHVRFKNEIHSVHTDGTVDTSSVSRNVTDSCSIKEKFITYQLDEI